MDHLEDLLKTTSTGPRSGPRFIVTESVFSMEGDLSPLADIAQLADHHNCTVILDEAHATGVFGTRGQGRYSEVDWGDVPLVTVHTCGKALGSSGAFVGCSEAVWHHLINHARKFIFSTAPPPLLMVQWQAALNVIEAEPERRKRLHRYIRLFPKILKDNGLTCGGESQIIIVTLGTNQRALSAAQAMQEQGFDIRAVRYPTVPRGQARLRITIHSETTPATMTACCQALGHWYASEVAHG